MTRDQCIREAGEAIAHGRIACAALTPREQAVAAWTPTSRLTVGQLEDKIRAGRGLPPHTTAA